MAKTFIVSKSWLRRLAGTLCTISLPEQLSLNIFAI